MVCFDHYMPPPTTIGMNHVTCRVVKQMCLVVIILGFVERSGTTTTALTVASSGNVARPPPTLETTIKDVSGRSVGSTVRIRSMREEDLKIASSLLANEIVGSQASANNKKNADRLQKAAMAWNHCKAHLDRIRQQTSVETELRCRLQAIQEGRNVWSKLCAQQPPSQIQQQSQQLLRWVWSHDTFRSKLQCAVQLHQQQQSHVDHNPHYHPLNEHNMNLVPGDARWLQHVMMVAEEETEIVKTNGADTTSTRRVIGFCEVGRMSTPMYYAARRQPGNDSGRASTFDDDEHNIFSAPTILNLVISPHARRRGVATNLVSTAQHYVRRVWKEHQLCLFVDTNNDEALSLYQRLGFVPSQVQQSQDVLETAPSSSSLEDANKSNHHVALWQSWSETLSPTSSMTENPPNRYCHLRSHLF